MKKYCRSLLFLALLLGAAGCSKESPDSDSLKDVGYLSTRFGMNADDRTTSPAQGQAQAAGFLATKAAANPENFWIQVKDRQTQQYVYQSLKNKISDLLELEVGSYDIEVSYPEVQDEAAFEQPHFYGKTSGEVVILKDQITEVSNIDATLQNMKVTVVFKDNVFSLFRDFKATVSNGAGSLEYTQYTSEAGYFNVAPLTVSFWGIRQERDDVVEKEFETPITNVGPAFHHNIVIDASFAYSSVRPAYPSIVTKSASETSDGTTARYDHYFVIE